MHPILADGRRLMLYVLACAAAGAGAAGLLVMAGLADPVSALAFAVPPSVVLGFVALSAYFLCRAMPHDQRRGPAAALRFVVAAGVAALVASGLAAAWNEAGRLGAAGRAFVALPPAGWVIVAAAGFGAYLLSLLAHDVLVAFERVREAARREADSRVLARDAELRLLRTQIDPHFLFNSLNSISALVAIDAEEARAMAIDLAQFFRRTLASGARGRVALADEVDLGRHYLAIERRRFGDQLAWDFEVDDAAARCAVPPMLLQPLLENALKHGLRGRPEGGTITLRAQAREGWLLLTVANPVPADAAMPLRREGRVSGAAPAARSGGDPREAQGLGLGLANLRARLALLHGERARLSWTRTDEQFTLEIAMPAADVPADPS